MSVKQEPESSSEGDAELDAELDPDNDVSYLARQLKKSKKLPEDDLVKLRYLEIKLIHEVPPQHQIESCSGSHAPSSEEIKRFQEIVPLKRGVYSPEEDKIIIKNWKTFCKLHEWDKKKVDPFLYLRNGTAARIRKKKQRRKFVQFLANGLPNRTLYSVYYRFRNLYEYHVQTRYKPEEDQMILDHVDNNPNLDEKRKFADVAKVLNRTRASVWRRYRLLKKKEKAKREYGEMLLS